jgi:hypothetical protein
MNFSNKLQSRINSKQKTFNGDGLKEIVSIKASMNLGLSALPCATLPFRVGLLSPAHRER